MISLFRLEIVIIKNNMTIHNAIIGIALETVSSGLGSGSESSAGGLYYNPRVQIRII